MFLTNDAVEGILRADLDHARSRVRQSLAAFLRIATEPGTDPRERLEQAAMAHSGARHYATAAAARLNQFDIHGVIPEDLVMETIASGITTRRYPRSTSSRAAQFHQPGNNLIV